MRRSSRWMAAMSASVLLTVLGSGAALANPSKILTFPITVTVTVDGNDATVVIDVPRMPRQIDWCAWSLANEPEHDCGPVGAAGKKDARYVISLLDLPAGDYLVGAAVGTSKGPGSGDAHFTIAP